MGFDAQITFGLPAAIRDSKAQATAAYMYAVAHDGAIRSRAGRRHPRWGAAPESGESGHHAHARAVQYSIFEYWNTGKTRI